MNQDLNLININKKHLSQKIIASQGSFKFFRILKLV